MKNKEWNQFGWFFYILLSLKFLLKYFLFNVEPDNMELFIGLSVLLFLLSKDK